MRRKLFTILAAMSLALCLGVIAVGVSSFWAGREIAYCKLGAAGEGSRRGHVSYILWAEGRVQVCSYRCLATTPAQNRRLPEFITPVGLSVHCWDGNGEPGYTTSLYRRLGQLGPWPRFKARSESWAPGSAGEFFSSESRRMIIFPGWLPALLFAILPALWLRRWRIERKRNRVGFCKTCGYDLRATPNRCPECGTIAAAPPAAAG